MNGRQLLELGLSSELPHIKSLSKALLANRKIAEKLESKPVTVGETERSYVLGGKRIFMANTEDTTANLHEAIHALTVQELKSNPEVAKQVTDLMNLARRESMAQGLFTSEEMDKISKDDKKDWNADGIFYTDENLSKSYGISYALRNEREFLAQVFKDTNVRNLLESIDLPNPKGKIRTAWDKFVQMVQKSLGLSNSQYTALHRALELTFELAEGDKVRTPISKRVGNILKRSKVDQAPLEVLKESHAPVITSKPQEFFKSTTDILKKLAMPITERLRDIDPQLIKYLRTMELNISRENVKASKVIQPFAELYNGLEKDDQMLLNWALKNNDEEALKIRKDILGDSFKDVEGLLGNINDRMESVGLNNFSPVEQYFPRKVKDIEGLMKFMRARKDVKDLEKELGRDATDEEKADIAKQAESLTLIEESLLQAQDKKGSALTPAEKAEVVNGIMNTGRYNAISFNIPSSAKARGIRRVSPEMDKFYEDSLDTLISHIYETNEAIESRKTFNFNNRKQLVREGNKVAKEYTKKLKNGENVEEELTRLEEISSELKALDEDTTEGISQFLAEKGLSLSTEEQKEVVSIFKARLDQKGTYGAFSTIRNAMLISTLGNPTSAVTQLGDIVWSIYDNGWRNTSSSIFGKKRMSKSDFDFERAMGDFTGGSSRYVDFALKWSGLKAMDLFGKDVYLEASLKKVEGMSEQQFIDNQAHVFGDKAGEVYRKILEGDWRDENGVPDPDVQYYAFNALSNTQPISLSEMPETYLTSGQGRILYTLKTYALKQINNVIREARKPGLANKQRAASLVMLLTLAGASADELKDLMLGRTTEFSDQLYDNLFKISLLSRYSLEGSRTGKGILTDLLVPPTGIIDYAKEDMVSLFKGDPSFTSIQNLPWGRQIQAWTPKGRSKSFENEKKSISEDFRKVLEKKGNLKSIRTRINKLNKKLKGTDIEPINYINSRRYHIRKIREEQRS